MNKKLKKVCIIGTVLGALTLGNGIQRVEANTLFNLTENNSIQLNINTWRPLISGNLRGESLVITRSTNSNRIGARVSSIGPSQNVTSVWNEHGGNAGTTLRIGSQVHSPTINGGSRTGVSFTGNGRTRATATAAWVNLSTSVSW